MKLCGTVASVILKWLLKLSHECPPRGLLAKMVFYMFLPRYCSTEAAGPGIATQCRPMHMAGKFS